MLISASKIFKFENILLQYCPSYETLTDDCIKILCIII